MNILAIWTIYQNPADFPDSFVARKFLADKPTGELLIAADLAVLRRMVQKAADYELIRMERSECDDPVIVESWL